MMDISLTGPADFASREAAPPDKRVPPRPHIETVSQTKRRLWIGDRAAIEVPCSIDMERSAETLHAHVSLDGIEVDCGDEVLIHAAPTSIEFGDRLTTTSRATVIKAGPLRRWLTRMESYFALTELYEVGFQPKHEIVFVPAKSSSAGSTSDPNSSEPERTAP